MKIVEGVHAKNKKFIDEKLRDRKLFSETLLKIRLKKPIKKSSETRSSN